MPRRQFILYILMLASFFYQETKLIDICTLSTIGAKQPGGTPSFGGGFGSGGGLGANQSGNTPSFGSAGSLGGLGSTNTGASGLGGGLGGGGSTTFGGWVLHVFPGVKVFSSMSSSLILIMTCISYSSFLSQWAWRRRGNEGSKLIWLWKLSRFWRG